MFAKLKSTLKRFHQFFTKNITVIRTIPETFLGVERWRVENFYKLAEEGYQRNVTVFRCVQIIAMACSTIPFVLYQKKKDGSEEIEEHEILRLLKHPNQRMGQGKLIETSISNLLISGNAYLYGAGPDDLRRPPLKLYALRPDCVSIHEGELLDEVKNYEYYDSKRKMVIPVERMLHLKLYNPLNDWYGMSPLIAAALNVDHKNTGVTWNYHLISNGARPQGLLTTEEIISDDQYETLKAMLDEHIGSGKIGKPLLLEGGLHWEDTSINPKDMDWLQGIKMDTREIAVAFGVPPQLVGDSENLTYSNYKEARKALYQETVLPLMRWFKDELNVWLTAKYNDPNLYLDLNIDDIDVLQEDREKAWERIGAAVDRGVLTRNEARDALGYEKLPIPELDTIYIPFSLTPIDESSQSEETEEEETDNEPPLDEPGQKKSPEYAIKGRRLIDTEEKQIERWETKRKNIWDPWESKWKKALREYFTRQEKEVLKNIGNTKTTIRESDLFSHADWDKILIRLASPLLVKILSAGVEDAANELGITVSWDLVNKHTLAWVKKECGTLIKRKDGQGLNEYTLSRLRDTLSSGIEAGEGINDLSKRIESVYDEARGYRSERIARTETIRGYREGNIELWEESEVVEEAEWWTALDERVCEECMALHGQTFPLQEARSKSQEIHPNCRCDLIPVVKK